VPHTPNAARSLPTNLTAVRRRPAGTRSGFFRRGALSWLALRLTGLLVVAAACAPPVDAQVPATASERSVKAAFVYKFLGYVDWPADAFAAPEAPLVIGVVEADDLAADLAEVVRNRFVSTHAIEVRTLRPADPLAGIHVLFVGAAAPARRSSPRPSPMRAAACSRATRARRCPPSACRWRRRTRWRTATRSKAARSRCSTRSWRTASAPARC
jgi:hypothetical protein